MALHLVFVGWLVCFVVVAAVVLRQGLSPNRKLTDFGKVCWLMSPRGSLVSTLQHWHYKNIAPHLASYVGPEDPNSDSHPWAAKTVCSPSHPSSLCVLLRFTLNKQKNQLWIIRNLEVVCCVGVAEELRLGRTPGKAVSVGRGTPAPTGPLTLLPSPLQKRRPWESVPCR